MKKFIRAMTVIFFALPMVFVLAGSPVAAAGEFSWNRTGYCEQHNQAGRLLGKVDDSFCVGKNYYKWNRSGYCEQHNQAGRLLGKVDDSFCVGKNYYKWNRTGYCEQHNAAERLLEIVKDSFCETGTAVERPSENSSKVDSANASSDLNQPAASAVQSPAEEDRSL